MGELFLTEPDVTLTDYFLMILCSGFAWSLWRQKTSFPWLQILWIIFFTSLATASLTGGTVHGFFLDESTFGYKLLWPATLLVIGVAATALWMLAGFIISGPKKIRRWNLFAAIAFILYAGVVIFYSQQFSVVIFNYLPAMVALLIASIVSYRRNRSNCFLFIVGGIVISFFASLSQQVGLAIHPIYFNHNSTYHLIQAFALLVLFKGSKDLLTLERIHQ
jgi:hypothetical protein